MEFLVGECKSDRITFGDRYMICVLHSTLFPLKSSGPSCGKNSGGLTASSPGSVVARVVSSFPISSVSGQGEMYTHLCDPHDASTVGHRRHQ